VIHRPSIFAPLIRLVRRIIGLICLGLALLGFILPIIPGWPFIIPAVVLLGRRDPMLRRLHLLVRHSLRALRRHRSPRIRQLGGRLSVEYVRGRRMIAPQIVAAERSLSWAVGSEG
jgi:hypothetical protein